MCVDSGAEGADVTAVTVTVLKRKKKLNVLFYERKRLPFFSKSYRLLQYLIDSVVCSLLPRTAMIFGAFNLCSVLCN